MNPAFKSPRTSHRSPTSHWAMVPALFPSLTVACPTVPCQRHHPSSFTRRPHLTIRKFKEDPLTMIDLVNFGTVNARLPP